MRFMSSKPSCSGKYWTVHSWYSSFIAHLTYTSKVNSALQECIPCRCSIQYMQSKPSHMTGKSCPGCYKQLQGPSNIREQTLSRCSTDNRSFLFFTCRIWNLIKTFLKRSLYLLGSIHLLQMCMQRLFVQFFFN